MLIATRSSQDFACWLRATASARLTREQDGLAFSILGPGPAAKQKLHFLVPPHERCQAGRMERLEATLHGTGAQRGPGPCRLGHALEGPAPEVFQVEEIAEKSSRAL